MMNDEEVPFAKKKKGERYLGSLWNTRYSTGGTQELEEREKKSFQEVNFSQNSYELNHSIEIL